MTDQQNRSRQDPPKPRRSRRRRAAIGAALLLVILVITVAALPAMISAGLGHSMIERLVSDEIAGDVSFQSLHVTWRGPQRVTGVKLRHPSGDVLSDLSVRVEQSLFTLIRRHSEVVVTGEGSISTHWRADQTLTLIEALEPTGPPSNEPTALPPLRVLVPRLDLAVDDELTGATHRWSIVDGQASYEPGGMIRGELSGELDIAGERGRLAVSADLDDPLAGGTVDLAGRRGNVSVRVDGLRLPMPDDHDASLSMLAVDISSDDLTQRVRVEIEGNGRLDDTDELSIAGWSELGRPVAADGTPTFDPQRLSGELSASDLPTSVLDAFVRGTAVSLQRDVGPTVDLTARLTPDQASAMQLSLNSAQWQADLRAAFDEQDGAMVGENWTVRGRLHPDLIADLADAAPTEPQTLNIEIASLRLPRASGTGFDFATLSTQGEISLADTATWRLPAAWLANQSDDAGTAAAQHVEVGGASVRFATSSVRDGVAVAGEAAVDRATLAFDQHIAGLLTPDCGFSFDPNRLSLNGWIEVRDVDAETIARFAPAQRDLLEALFVEPAAARLETASAETGIMNATLTAGAGEQNLNASAQYDGSRLRIAPATASATMTPALVDALPANITAALGEMRFLGATHLTLRTEPFDVPWMVETPTEIDLTGRTIIGSIELDRLAVAGLPSVTSSVRLDDLRSDVTWQPAKPHAIAADFTVRLADHDHDRALTRLAGRLQTYDDDPDTQMTVAIDLTDLNLAALETALGRPGELTAWLGDAGSASIEARADSPENVRLTLETDTSQYNGRITAHRDGPLLRIAADNQRLTIPAQRLDALLARIRDPDASPSTTSATAPASVRIDLPQLALPLAVLRDEPFEPHNVDVQGSVTIDHLTLQTADGKTFGLSNTQLDIETHDLADGIDFNMASAITGDHDAETGDVQLTGRLQQLIGDDGRVSASDWRVAIDASGRAIPTAMIDTIAGFEGYLVDAIGPHVDLHARSEGFSPDGGRMDLELLATAGRLDAQIHGGDGMLLLPGDDDLRAELELTADLRQRLLKRIHPLLADVRTVEQPIRATVGNARIPLNGEMSQLNADLEMTIGDVMLDGGSATLAALRLFEQADQTSVPARIEPIRARIRDGRVTYDRFTVAVGPYALAFSGMIDLPSREVDLRWNVPLTALAQVAPETRPFVADLTVPMRTRGTFESYATRVDPDFDLGAALLRAGVGGGLREVLRREDKLPLDRLRDLLGQGGDSSGRDREPINPVDRVLRDLLRGRDD